MIGSTIFIEVESSSRSFASCVAPSMFASVEYAFSTERAVREAALGEPLAHLACRPPSSATKASSSHGL